MRTSLNNTPYQNSTMIKNILIRIAGSHILTLGVSDEERYKVGQISNFDFHKDLLLPQGPGNVALRFEHDGSIYSNYKIRNVNDGADVRGSASCYGIEMGNVCIGLYEGRKARTVANEEGEAENEQLLAQSTSLYEFHRLTISDAIDTSNFKSIVVHLDGLYNIEYNLGKASPAFELRAQSRSPSKANSILQADFTRSPSRSIPHMLVC